jgi:hypothetical protein
MTNLQAESIGKLNDQMDFRISFDEIFAAMSAEEKDTMFENLMMMNECQRVLANTKHSIVSEALRFTDKFEYWKHVPPKDVLDGHSGSQYYYHAHPASGEKTATTLHDGEHGHFHTFMRRAAILDTEKPFPAPDYDDETDNPKRHTAHIIGLSMDKAGKLTGMFTTNRWVTGEVWYNADDVIAMAGRYQIDHAQPSWPVNMWMSHCFAAFMPVIKQLVLKRDETIAQWTLQHGDGADYNIFEDRRLEALSYCPIDLPALLKQYQ